MKIEINNLTMIYPSGKKALENVNMKAVSILSNHHRLTVNPLFGMLYGESEFNILL